MTKKEIYHTKLQHSKRFVIWFTKKYNVDLKSLQKDATNAYDPACNIVLRNMSKQYMWAIYYNIVVSHLRDRINVNTKTIGLRESEQLYG